MKTVTLNLYTYAELCDAAKAKAREWWLGLGGVVDAEFTIDDAKTMGAHMGIRVDKVYYSGFSSQGDGACFEGEWRADMVDLADLMEAAPKDEELHRICRGFEHAAKVYPESSFTVKHRGHYHHAYCTVFDFDSGDDETEVHWNFPEDDLALLARDFMRWIYRQLEENYNFQTSEENVAETLIANEYTFTVDGKRYEP